MFSNKETIPLIVKRFLEKNGITSIKKFSDVEQLFLEKNSIVIPTEVMNKILVHNFKFIRHFNIVKQLEIVKNIEIFTKVKDVAYIKQPTNEIEKLILISIYKCIINKKPSVIKCIKHSLLTMEICNYAFNIDSTIFPFIPNEYKTFEQALWYNKKIINLRLLFQKIRTFKPKFNCLTSDLLIDGFGVELEFITSKNELVELLLKDALNIKLNREEGVSIKNMSIWYIEKDSTTYDMYEIISKKISNIEDLNLLLKLVKCLQILEFEKIITLTNQCGFHIHRNAKKYSYEKVQKIEEMYINNSNIIYKLLNNSRRDNRYCKMQKCSSLSEEELDNKTVTTLKNHKFSAVNTNAYFYNNTIEFRQHEATNSAKEILAWIEFTGKLLLHYKNVHKNIFMHSLFNQIKMANKTKLFYYKKYLKNYRSI